MDEKEVEVAVEETEEVTTAEGEATAE